MRFTCPSCSKAYRLSRDRLGASGQAKIRCPNCKIVVRVAAGQGDELICTLSQTGVHEPLSPTLKSRAPEPTGPQAGAGGEARAQISARQSGPAASQAAAAAPAPAAQAAQAPDPAQWHVAIQKKAEGPMPRAALAEMLADGRITAASLGWRKGQDGWKRLREIPELASLFAQPAVPRSTLPATGQPSGEQVTRAAEQRAAAEVSAVKSTLKSAAASPAPQVAQTRAAQDQAARAPAPAERRQSNDSDHQATVMADVVELPEPSGRLDRKPQAAHRDIDPTRREAQASGQPVAKSLRGTVPVPADEGGLDEGGLDEGGLDALDGGPTMEQPVIQAGRRSGRRGKRGDDRRRTGERKGTADQEVTSKPATTAEPGKAQPGRPLSGAAAADAARGQPAQPQATRPAAAQPQAQKPKAAQQPAAAAAGPLPPARPAAAKAASAHQGPKADEAKVKVAGQTASFFETGQSFMSDVDFALPDPNKHKPTKEEYNSLLQEFSVMFRLDKRTKRQKWGIVAVLSFLLLGVIAFGVILVVQGEQRKNLIRDSKTILAVFSLPYQTSVTVRVGGDDQQKGAVVSTSKLAGELQKKLADMKLRRKQIKTHVAAARRPSGPAELQGGTRQGGLMPTKLTKAQILEQEREARKAIEENLAAMGGRVERGVGVKPMTTDVTAAQLRSLCDTKRQALFVCGQRHASGASFRAVLTIGDSGTVDKVQALVDGSPNAALSRCAAEVFSRTRYGLQSKTRTHSCTSGGE